MRLRVIRAAPPFRRPAAFSASGTGPCQQVHTCKAGDGFRGMVPEHHLSLHAEQRDAIRQTIQRGWQAVPCDLSSMLLQEGCPVHSIRQARARRTAAPGSTGRHSHMHLFIGTRQTNFIAMCGNTRVGIYS